MKKFKLVIFLIIVALLLLFVFQNQDYFQQKHVLGIDLMVTEPFKTPETSNAVLFAVCLVVGGILSFLLSLSGRMKNRKTIKMLKSNIDLYRREIAALKDEVSSLKTAKPDSPETGGALKPPEIETKAPSAA